VWVVQNGVRHLVVSFDWYGAHGYSWSHGADDVAAGYGITRVTDADMAAIPAGDTFGTATSTSTSTVAAASAPAAAPTLSLWSAFTLDPVYNNPPAPAAAAVPAPSVVNPITVPATPPPNPLTPAVTATTGTPASTPAPFTLFGLSGTALLLVAGTAAFLLMGGMHGKKR
jgi:hypothetical protein